MSDPLSIRAATESDLDSLVGVINAAFKVEEFFKTGDRTNPADIRTRMRAGTFIVAEDRGRVVGAVLVDRHGDVGHYAMLAIDPAEQKRGIGLKLMTAAEDWCRAAGCREVEIEVVDLRSELPAFYTKHGYTIRGTRPFPDHFEATRACHFVVWTKSLG